MSATTPRVLISLLTVLLATVTSALADTVTNTNDSGPGSLRDAIANSLDESTINFELTGCPCTIALTTGQIEFSKSLTIVGPGFDLLEIRGNNASRVFQIRNSTTTLEGLTIENGRAVRTSQQYSDSGGGILSVNTSLTISNSVVARNSAMFIGGGVFGVQGTLTIVNSRISENDAELGGGMGEVLGTSSAVNSVFLGNRASLGGGAVYANSYATLSFVTASIEGNQAPGSGSALYVFQYSTCNINRSSIVGNIGGAAITNAASTMTITNSTVSGQATSASCIGNSSFTDLSGGPITSELTISNSTITSNGGGINTRAEVDWPAVTTIRNSIVAGNSSSPDVTTSNGGTFESSGYNLIGNRGDVTVFIQPGDQAGTDADPLDPRLEPLAFNGGPTKTHALKLTSTAVDRGKAFGSAADQRGRTRPSDNPDIGNAPGGDGSDIGAFETQFPLSGTISISGRVQYKGDIVRSHGFVTLTDSNLNTRHAVINPFGFYRFEGVPLGRLYTVSLMARRWSIEPQTIFAAEPITNLDLIAR